MANDRHTLLTTLMHSRQKPMLTMAAFAPCSHDPGGPDAARALPSEPEVQGEMDQVTDATEGADLGQPHAEDQERPVRLSVNLSNETARTFRELIRRKGLSITEGIRRAIIVWKFVEDETSRGNQIAVIERDESIRKVILL